MFSTKIANYITQSIKIITNHYIKLDDMHFAWFQKYIFLQKKIRENNCFLKAVNFHIQNELLMITFMGLLPQSIFLFIKF